MNNTNATASALIRYGLVVVAVALIGLFVVMFPAIKNEIKYLFTKNIAEDVVLTEKEAEPTKIVVKDPEFSIVIPKIGANSKVIKDVDPYDKDVYLQALRTGVAHAEGTSYPSRGGNTFLFAHSTDNFYNANRYNSVFYLLNKMEVGDDIYVAYENNLYKYAVSEIKLVDASDVSYLEGNSTDDVLTLMTCWPAGTTLQRLLVIGTKVTN